MSKYYFFITSVCRTFRAGSILSTGLLLFAGIANAQVYPIRVSTQLTPPYTPYLTDYTSPGSQRLMVQLTANDVSISNYQCRFRITIDGVGITIRTKQNFVPQATTFYGGGAPQILYGEDLLEYFNPNNLDFSGLSRSEFVKTGKLPEGIYRFTIEVLDYNRGVVVSNKGLTVAWIILNDPPLLNLPRNNNKLQILDPTYIPFTWTPRHTGSPNAAFSTEYTFRIVEIWPAGRNPYDAFLSQPPLYEITTTQSQVVYGLTEPALIPGRKYAWQVQAHDTEGRDLFKNQGRSEVYVFQFGDMLGIPQNLREESTNSSVIGLRWEPHADGEYPDRYRIQYRPSGSETWYEQVTDKLWCNVGSLQPDRSYDIRIRSEKANRHSEYSTTVRMKTTADNNIEGFQCGTSPEIESPSGNISIPQLTPGDTFRASDFNVTVTEVTSSTNGLYIGKGLMSVKYFSGASIVVKFSGTINDKYELTTGSVESIYDPTSEWSNVVEEMYKIGEQPPVDSTENTVPVIIYPGIIDSLYVNAAGQIVVVGEDGTTTEYERKKNKETGQYTETLITDAEGNTYKVDSNGNVTEQGTTAGVTAVANTQGYQVEFQPSTDQLFGLDAYTYLAHSYNYEQTTINGSQQVIRWKSVATGRTDKVIAEAQGHEKLFDEVSYRSTTGPVPRKQGEQGVEVTVTGTGHQQITELRALITSADSAQKDKELTVGKLNVISYDPIVKHWYWYQSMARQHRWHLQCNPSVKYIFLG